jgi:hypothetical protein
MIQKFTFNPELVYSRGLEHQQHPYTTYGSCMSGWLIAGVGLVYLGVSVEQALKGNWGMGIVFAGYAFSNVGFLVAMR